MDTALDILAQLPEGERDRLREIMDKLRLIVDTHGEHGLLAFGLLGLEIQEQM